MNEGNSSLNPSSFLDLKAELQKKYDSFKRDKLNQSSEIPRRSGFRCKNDPAKPKKEKLNSDTKSRSIDNEEELVLKKSRLALEAKAKLYEKIVSNNILIDDEDNEKYMVNFQRKVLYGEPLPQKSTNYSPSSHSQSSSSGDVSIDNATKHTARNLTAASSKAPENSFDPDQPIHYQNVQFNEVRDHGTGYFAFSTNAEQRKEQMDELNAMRKETEKQRLLKQNMLKKRKAFLQARLAKVCERKNIDQSVLDTLPGLKTGQDEIPSQTPIDVASIPLPLDESKVIEDKETKIRPWDIGKDSLQAFVPEKAKKTPKNYVEERREERLYEFAPPKIY